MPKRKKGRDLSKWRSNRPDPGEGSVRIIGGFYRGASLVYSGDKVTRPMKSSIREALFNLVGGFLEDTIAIDLFAGTGVVGLEAVSRGASHALLIERHVPTTKIIRQNVQTIHVEDATTIIGSDTFFWARQLEKELTRRANSSSATDQNQSMPPDSASTNSAAGSQQNSDTQNSDTQNSDSAPDIHSAPWSVFCCPPYDLYVDKTEEVLTLLNSMIELAPKGSLFVVESDARFDTNLLPKSDQWSIREYAPAVVSVLRDRENSMD